jgi:hypothetical protein
MNMQLGQKIKSSPIMNRRMDLQMRTNTVGPSCDENEQIPLSAPFPARVGFARRQRGKKKEEWGGNGGIDLRNVQEIVNR